MNTTQKSYLANLTADRAQKVIDKFGGDPAIADAKSAEAYHAFCVCWEFLNEGEYVQRHRAAGGVDYRFVSI